MSNIRIIVVNHADRFPLTNSATENLCLQNSAFNESPWMVTGTTVTPNTGMGISGANVADTIADTSGVATQSLSQTITVPNDGQVYTCLFAQRGYDLKTLVRSGAGDDALLEAVTGIWQRRADRYSEIRTAETAKSRKVEMSFIGG